MPIIESLLDNDLYKFTMMQAVLHNYPATMVEYKFKHRNGNGFPKDAARHEFLRKLDAEIDNLCILRFSNEELEYLSNIPYLTPDFIEYLRLFKLNKEHVYISVDSEGNLDIRVKGPWVNTILFEVYILAIVSELHSSFGPYAMRAIEGRERLHAKVEYVADKAMGMHGMFKFADFGTRRRWNREWHFSVVDYIMKEIPSMFAGTSNLYLAKKHNITPIGTMAHEWLQAHQQLGVRLVDSQKQALEVWAQEYRGELGIALSDCVGFKAFLNDFDKYFAKLFDGCRHDSGDPYDWCEALIEHYRSLKIDPKTKTAIFSDGLNFEKAVDLYASFNPMINVGFGIGTFLTNDMGEQAPQIVMKLVKVNGNPVAKISDSSGKGMCEDPEFENYLKKVFNIGG